MSQPDLAQLGFSKKEATIYLLLLKYKKLTIPNIARHSSLKRTTVYAVVDELLARGVVTEDKAARQRTILALPPDGLMHAIQQEKKAIHQKEQLTQAVVDELNEIEQETLYPTPGIRFVPENEIKDFMRERTPIWNASIKKADGVWWGFQEKSYIEHYQDVIDRYWHEPSSQGVTVKVLSNQTDLEDVLRSKSYNQQRLVRFWSLEHPFTSTIWPIGDYVLIMRSHKHPHYLVEHHDPELARNLRQLFSWIWDTVQQKK